MSRTSSASKSPTAPSSVSASIPSLTRETTQASQDSVPAFGSSMDDFVLFPEDNSSWNMNDMSLPDFTDLNEFNFDVNDFSIVGDQSFDFSAYDQAAPFAPNYIPELDDQYGLNQWASAIGDSQPTSHTDRHPSTSTEDNSSFDPNFYLSSSESMESSPSPDTNRLLSNSSTNTSSFDSGLFTSRSAHGSSDSIESSPAYHSNVSYSGSTLDSRQLHQTPSSMDSQESSPISHANTLYSSGGGLDFQRSAGSMQNSPSLESLDPSDPSSFLSNANSLPSFPVSHQAIKYSGNSMSNDGHAHQPLVIPQNTTAVDNNLNSTSVHREVNQYSGNASRNNSSIGSSIGQLDRASIGTQKGLATFDPSWQLGSSPSLNRMESSPVSPLSMSALSDASTSQALGPQDSSSVSGAHGSASSVVSSTDLDASSKDMNPGSSSNDLNRTQCRPHKWLQQHGGSVEANAGVASSGQVGLSATQVTPLHFATSTTSNNPLLLDVPAAMLTNAAADPSLPPPPTQSPHPSSLTDSTGTTTPSRDDHELIRNNRRLGSPEAYARVTSVLEQSKSPFFGPDESPTAAAAVLPAESLSSSLLAAANMQQCSLFWNTLDAVLSFVATAPMLTALLTASSSLSVCPPSSMLHLRREPCRVDGKT